MAQADSDLYKCETCAHRNCDADGRRRWIGQDGKERRSRGPSPAARPRWDFSAQGLGTRTTCPLLDMPTDFGLICSLYEGWKVGALWTSGGLKSQPARYLDVMRIVANEVASIQAEKLKEIEGR